MPMSMDQEEPVGRTENQHTAVSQTPGRIIISDNRSSARSPQLDVGELIVDK